MSLIRQTNPTDFMLEVAKGNVAGHTHVNKFGHNPAASTGEDIWGGGGVYPYYPTAGVLVDAVSTSTSDAAAQVGAIQLTVQGLDASWVLQEETITLTGTTVVQLAGSYIRLFRAFVAEAGTSNSNAGDITVYARATGSGVTAGDVGIFVEAGGGQTQQCIYTIPDATTGYFIKGYVGLGTTSKTAQEGVFRWLMRINNGVNGAWLTQGEVGLTNIGSSHWQYEYGIPAGPLAEHTDIRISMQLASIAFNTVGGFDLLLVADGF